MDSRCVIWLALISLLAFAGVACGDGPADDSQEEESHCESASTGGWKAGLEDLEKGALMSVWGPAPDQVYTVGGQPEAGVAYKFDGLQWTELQVPQGPMLNWVHGVGEDIWFVGNEGRALRLKDGEFEKFETGIEDDFWGVWAADEDDIWAVGGDARDFDAQPVLAHFNGEEWSALDLPDFDRDANALFKVWGTRPDHVFAVGALGLILHYDGEQWRQVSTGTGEDFVSLWGRHDDEIVAVGGRSNGIVSRWDGDGWTTETLTGSPGLNGVWMDCTGVAHINGDRGHVFRLKPNSFDRIAESTTTRDVLHASFGFDGGPRFAVGGTLDISPPYFGIALESGTP